MYFAASIFTKTKPVPISIEIRNEKHFPESHYGTGIVSFVWLIFHSEWQWTVNCTIISWVYWSDCSAKQRGQIDLLQLQKRFAKLLPHKNECRLALPAISIASIISIASGSQSASIISIDLYDKPCLDLKRFGPHSCSCRVQHFANQ